MVKIFGWLFVIVLPIVCNGRVFHSQDKDNKLSPVILSKLNCMQILVYFEN